MSNRFDLEAFRLSGDAVASPSVSSKRAQQWTEPFFKGYIPLAWTHAAANASGKAFHVAMAIWHQQCLRKSDTFSLSGKIVREFGVNRGALYRALKALEGARLVEVSRAPGRSPKVRVLPLPYKAESILRQSSELFHHKKSFSIGGTDPPEPAENSTSKMTVT